MASAIKSFISGPKHSGIRIPKRNGTGGGLRQQELLQSQSPDIQKTYDKVFGQDNDSLTTVAFNDVASSFRVAIARFFTTQAQRESLEELKNSFRRIEFLIDPQRLRFTFGTTPDEDIVIIHKHSEGVTSLIVHDDGSVAFSLITYRGVNKANILTFHDPLKADWESLALNFLIGQ